MERLFLSFDLTEVMRERLSLTQDQVRSQMKKSKILWVKPENFHITLHFLGDVDANHKGALIEALKSEEFPRSFSAKAIDVCGMPNKKSPKVLWLNVKLPTEAMGVYKRTANALLDSGLDISERRWQPHITLGRVQVRSEVLKPECVDVDIKPFSISSFSLMKSTLAQEGSDYTTVETFSL